MSLVRRCCGQMYSKGGECAFILMNLTFKFIAVDKFFIE